MHINTVPELKKNKTSQSIGRSQGGLSTKIHAICDGLGRPTAFHLTGGQVHDLSGADALLGGIQAKILLADKAYDAEKRVLSRLKEKDFQGVIPCRNTRKVQRPYNKSLYKSRHLIENFWAKLKQYRAIATRYDKLAINFLGSIHLVGAFFWLN